MRSDLEQNDRSGPPGIRAGVWLFVLSLLLLCALAISLFRRDATGPSSRTAFSSNAAARRDSTATPRPSTWRPARKSPELSSQGGLEPLAALTAEQAKDFARNIANERARELYDCEPFWDGPPVRFVEGRWVWSDCRGRGPVDIEATVQFAADGSTNSVDVLMLDNRALRDF
jgi:hypothetical protein